MDEPMAPQPEPNQQKALTNNNGDAGKRNKVLSLVLAILLAASLGVNAWQYAISLQAANDKAQLNKEKADLQTMVDQLKNAQQNAATGESSEACNDAVSEVVKENIKAALDSKNTAVFATYASNPVKFVLAASEKGGNESPDQAATDMEYTHSATGPWNFSLPASTLSTYDASFYTDYFDHNAYVGKSASGMVVSFDFDCDGKINQIFITANEDLLL